MHYLCEIWASMRPRVFPAEDPGHLGVMQHVGLGFNEAAGIPRGRRITRSINGCCSECFNEAAGIPRGRRIPRGIHRAKRRRFNEAAGIPRGRQREIGPIMKAGIDPLQ